MHLAWYSLVSISDVAKCVCHDFDTSAPLSRYDIKQTDGRVDLSLIVFSFLNTLLSTNLQKRGPTSIYISLRRSHLFVSTDKLQHLATTTTTTTTHNFSPTPLSVSQQLANSTKPTLHLFHQTITPAQFQNVFILRKLLRTYLLPSLVTRHTKSKSSATNIQPQGSVNCHNVVNRFGDRCKLCLALKSGASMSDGMLPEDAHRSKGGAVEAPRKHHYRSNEPSSKTIRVDSSHSSSRHRH